MRLASALLAALAGCTEIEPSQLPPPGADVAATDAWRGRWTGPDTYLDIGGGGGRYDLTIADLDGPCSFQGQVQGGQHRFPARRAAANRPRDRRRRHRDEVARGPIELARSTGVALFVGDWAVAQLWLFWLAPIVGAAVGALIYKVIGDERS